MNCSSWNAWICQRRLTAKAFAKYVVIDQEQKHQSFCHTYPLQKPALRVHWLVPKQPNSSRNRAQHAFPAQRPESLTSRTDILKKQSFCHTYPLQKPALRVHWLVPKQPNSSRNRAQHAFPAQRPESLTLRADALKKQSFCHTYALQKPALTVHWLVPKRPNSSRIRAQHAFPAQRPESLTSRTDALKKQSLCHTYLLQKPALRVHWLVPKQPKSSRNRAQHAFPARRPESLTSHTDALKKTKLMPHLYLLQKPALRVHWLVPKQPNSSRNRAQHAFPAQRPESLTSRTDALKKQSFCHTYPLQKPALRVHWLVAKQPNSSRNRAQHAFPAQRPESLTSRTDALKKQSFCHTYPLQKPALRVHWLVAKQPNSSRNRAQHAFPAQRPESLTSRTDALKKQSLCHTYLLPKTIFESPLNWLVPKQPNSSRNRAQHAFPAQRPESLTSRTDALKKQSLCHTFTYCKNQLWESIGWFRNSRTAAGIVPNMPSQHTAPRISNVAYWRPKKTKLLPHLPIAETSFESPLAGSETAEQQQESCPTCLPSTAPRISDVASDALKKQSLCHTYPLQKPALRVHWLVAKQPNSSRNRAQHAFPAQRPESLTSRTDALKKTKLLPHLPIAKTSFESPLAGSETAEQQQESCPTCLPSTAPRISNVAYWRPKKTKLMPHLPIAKNHLWESIELAGSETAEQQQESCPTCLPSTAPRISNVAYWRPKKTKLMPHLYLLQKPALRVHWLVPKQPNSSSRNRAQHAFPAQRPESLTSRTDALKKQSFCHTYPLQKPALRVHWLVPKQPNSSRNRAQHALTQHSAPNL